MRLPPRDERDCYVLSFFSLTLWCWISQSHPIFLTMHAHLDGSTIILYHKTGSKEEKNKNPKKKKNVLRTLVRCLQNLPRQQVWNSLKMASSPRESTNEPQNFPTPWHRTARRGSEIHWTIPFPVRLEILAGSQLILRFDLWPHCSGKTFPSRAVWRRQREKGGL